MEEKKQNERITSPERLDGYLRVIRPSMWVALVGVLFAVAAVFIWAFLGKSSITISQTGFVSERKVTCVFNDEQSKLLSVGQEMTVGGEKTRIKTIERVGEENGELVKEEDEGTICIVTGYCNKPGGYYDVSVRVDNVSPISFMFG